MTKDVSQTVALLDLTTLTGSETDTEIADLCAKAQSPAGPVAAVCVYPQYVAQCVRELDGTGIAVAAVANFPAGDLDADGAIRDATAAVEAGADEVDVVLPWRAWLDGDHEGAIGVVTATREATHGVLKVILESGSFPDVQEVRTAADAVLAAGADFVKTSTGKHGQGASPEAARAMLEAIRAAGHGGFKASGGVRTPQDADAYLGLATEVMGEGWATPQTFRIGASSLLDALLAP
jgi:deoxyribose-phosphate aldolase